MTANAKSIVFFSCGAAFGLAGEYLRRKGKRESKASLVRIGLLFVIVAFVMIGIGCLALLSCAQVEDACF